MAQWCFDLFSILLSLFQRNVITGLFSSNKIMESNHMKTTKSTGCIGITFSRAHTIDALSSFPSCDVTNPWSAVEWLTKISCSLQECFNYKINQIFSYNIKIFLFYTKIFLNSVSRFISVSTNFFDLFKIFTYVYNTFYL